MFLNLCLNKLAQTSGLVPAQKTWLIWASLGKIKWSCLVLSVSCVGRGCLCPGGHFNPAMLIAKYIQNTLWQTTAPPKNPTLVSYTATLRLLTEIKLPLVYLDVRVSHFLADVFGWNIHQLQVTPIQFLLCTGTVVAKGEEIVHRYVLGCIHVP